MSDKTCGTCANCAKRHGPEEPMANHVCMHMGTLIVDCGMPNCAGLYYEERTDSVEQVVYEMLYCIVRLTEADGGCNGDSNSGTPECEYAGEFDPCYKVFEDRLHALGVIA